jgi:hypothetical protein
MKSATKPIRAINHRCCPGPVEASAPLGAVCGAAVVGVAIGAVVGVAIGCVVGGDVVATDVLVAPVDAPVNEIAPTARSPLMSPMATTQVSPAAS